MKAKIIAIVALISIITWITPFTFAQVPEEPHDANAMWVEPSLIDVTDRSIGDKFNVTVWLNVTVDCGCWQFKLIYNKNYLNITRCVYTGTAGAKSQFFENTGTMTYGVPPSFNTYDDTHDYVLHGESWASGPWGTGVGSLSWIEFEIITEPTFTCILDISSSHPSDTYIRDSEFNKILLEVGDTAIIPEFHSELLVIFLSLTLLAALLSAKKKK